MLAIAVVRFFFWLCAIVSSIALLVPPLSTTPLPGGCGEALASKSKAAGAEGAEGWHVDPDPAWVEHISFSNIASLFSNLDAQVLGCVCVCVCVCLCFLFFCVFLQMCSYRSKIEPNRNECDLT